MTLDRKIAVASLVITAVTLVIYIYFEMQKNQSEW